MTQEPLHIRRPKKARATSDRVKPRLEITSRDQDILLFIGLSGYVSTDHIAREFFSSADRARHRIRQLFDAKYLSVVIWRANEPNLLRLTPLGYQYLAAQGPDIQNRLLRPGPIREENIPEHLLLVDTRLYAVAFGAYHKTPLTRWGSTDSHLAQELNLNRWRLYPDAVAEFATGDGPAYVAVVLDRPDRRLGASFLRQLTGYCDAALSGALQALWLVTADDAERRDALERSLAAARLDEFAHLLTHRQLVDRPIQGKDASSPGRSEASNHPEIEADNFPDDSDSSHDEARRG